MRAPLRGTGSGLFTAVLLLLVVSGPLTFGLMRFYTDLTRGGRPGAGAVLQPITSGASLWTGIRMSFCLFLRSLMWTVPPTVLLTIGAVAVSAMSFMTGNPDSMTGGLIVLYAVYGLVSFLISIKLMTYSAGWVVMPPTYSAAASARFSSLNSAFSAGTCSPSRRSICASCSACSV